MNHGLGGGALDIAQQRQMQRMEEAQAQAIAMQHRKVELEQAALIATAQAADAQAASWRAQEQYWQAKTQSYRGARSESNDRM